MCLQVAKRLTSACAVVINFASIVIDKMQIELVRLVGVRVFALVTQ